MFRNRDAVSLKQKLQKLETKTFIWLIKTNSKSAANKKPIKQKSARVRSGAIGAPAAAGAPKWEPVLAMNGKRVTKKGLWMQAKALIRKLQIMKR